MIFSPPVCFIRPDLMDNYLAFVLSAFITSGLLEVSKFLGVSHLMSSMIVLCYNFTPHICAQQLNHIPFVTIGSC